MALRWTAAGMMEAAKGFRRWLGLPTSSLASSIYGFANAKLVQAASLPSADGRTESRLAIEGYIQQQFCKVPGFDTESFQSQKRSIH
jgi:hypothetical protein